MEKEEGSFEAGVGVGVAVGVGVSHGIYGVGSWKQSVKKIIASYDAKFPNNFFKKYWRT